MARDERDIVPAIFTVTNWNEDRALDCSGDADNAIADTLGTLIGDLIRQGILKGPAPAA